MKSQSFVLNGADRKAGADRRTEALESFGRKPLMPPYSSLQPPTPFARWKKAKVLFDDAVAVTETFVINDDITGNRCAFGWSPDGYWFHVAMTVAEEPQFWHAYLDWRGRNLTGSHEFISAPIVKRPPARIRNSPSCR